MSYSNPRIREYSFPAVNFATSSSQVIRGPRGKTGRLRDVHVSATVLFTAVTTQGRVDIGTSGTAAAYGTLGLGTLAAGSAISAKSSLNSASGSFPTAEDLPADTDVKVSFQAPTGGTPAGTGTVTVTIEWDD